MKPQILLAVAFLVGSVSAQDIPEKTTDAFYKNDILLKSLVETKPHTLTAVRKTPDSYRGLPVTMEVVFHETRRAGNPFFTRFTTDSFVCVAAWGAEQPIWHADEFRNDFPMLFVDRHNAPVLRTLLEARTFDRIKISAIVRDIFRGLPYLEIRKAEAIEDGNIGEATILHGSKGKKAADSGEHQTALQEFDRAMRGNLPNDMKIAMYADVAEVHLARGDRSAAAMQLRWASELRPEDSKLKDAYERAMATPASTTTNESTTPKATSMSVGPTSRPAGSEKTGTN